MESSVSTGTCDFKSLPAYKTRTFVPMDCDLQDAGQVTALYKQLLDRPINSAGQLEQWLMDRSEVEAAVSQMGEILMIGMTCQTDNTQRSDSFKHFITTVVPAIKPVSHELDRKYVEAAEKYKLDKGKYLVYDRNTAADVALFRDENVELQTQEQLLVQEYQTICGAMMVHFQDKELTMPQMAKFLLEPDRALREQAWRATAARRLCDKDKLEDLFDKMLELRGRIAKNAGLKSYRDFIWQEYHRFDYTPANCRQFHDAVEKHVVPVLNRLAQQRKTAMKIDTLRPWDMDADVFGRGPLKPFENAEQFTQGIFKIFQQIKGEFAHQFKDMLKLGLMDLASRKGKAPGGYMTALNEARKPFIFMNAVGTHSDVNTLLHEGGHALHAFAAAGHELVSYRHSPIEFAEVASMGMELLGAKFLSTFYNQEDLKRCRRDQLEHILQILAWIATIDAFQHWIYEHPSHSREERKNAWLEIHQRFGNSNGDWNGLETEHAYLWQRQLHIFQIPFYYIEYGIAEIGALQLWVASINDYNEAVDNYHKALSLGGSKPLPELFAAAQLQFDLSEATIAPLVQAVLGQLEAAE